MTVNELLTRASSNEIMEWRVLLQIEASERKQVQGTSVGNFPTLKGGMR